MRQRADLVQCGRIGRPPHGGPVWHAFADGEGLDSGDHVCQPNCDHRSRQAVRRDRDETEGARWRRRSGRSA
ncbi:hypothetical protein BOSEA31B_13037 [Hyphomicrobiales bacterium]|nr:hypothetical protein BOSEA31B_13037 [Hyphomicrobiales bacterium]CAH1698809.1 hypothetical protein BOSEA1005_11862 [Hyphomicrobiales bacterium]CAI0342455.1 hypothetical protein BO1005MUT1_180234 [Hyphomicrobiales bacterium]